mmetsp:Transcript_79717/g.221858  ORF Transcript_79717/g.221858 Transcript_79717/m.221858 type:complete len:365 (-) Transcript_79717:801-1895(-)
MACMPARFCCTPALFCACNCCAAKSSCSGENWDCAVKACTVDSSSAEMPATAAEDAWGARLVIPNPSAKEDVAPPPARGCAIPAATAAARGCFSHLDASNASCVGSGVDSISLEKSVGDSSLRLRRSVAGAGCSRTDAVAGSSKASPESMSGCAAGAWPLAELPLLLAVAPLPPLSPPLSRPCSVARPPESPSRSRSRSRSRSCSRSSLRRCRSCCALRMALSFCTRFTVVGMRTPSDTCFFFSSSSALPLMSQSRAACVLFWWSRSARRAGPSSKPWDSSEESERGSTGMDGASSPGSSRARLSISLVEKSATSSVAASSLSCNSISTCASKCSGVISTMGRNSMREGSDDEIAWAEVAKNSY